MDSIRRAIEFHAAAPPARNGCYAEYGFPAWSSRVL